MCIFIYRNSGIEAVRIVGSIKGPDYIPGQVINPEPQHEWNAVRFHNSGWHLIDLTWAAGHIPRGSEEFLSDFCDHFLFTNPRDFVREHLPSDPRWQLLNKPLTVSDFEKDSYLRPGFFQNAILSCSVSSGILHCYEESATISFQLSHPLWFTYSFCQISSGKNLDQCVTLRWTKNQSSFTMFFPSSGSYVLRVYARDTKSMREVLVQRVEAHNNGNDGPALLQYPLPGLSSLKCPVLWGFTAYSEELPLTLPKAFQTKLSKTSGSFTTPSLTLNADLLLTAVVFELSQEAKSTKQSGIKKWTVKPTKQNESFRLELRFPMKAELHRLALFAQKSSEGTPRCFCNFLLVP